jgi:two-component system response regulator NreC
MSISILLADDHRIIRDGLRSLLSTMPGMKVVGEAENGRQALRIARKYSPDLVIMDISMPDLNGIEATRQILAESPGTKVIALSMHSDRQFVVRMFRAGVSGYLLKNGAFEELVHAIDTVRKNETYLSPKIASVLVKDLLDTTEDNSASSVLTAREREVLQLIAEGRTTREIASDLNVSIKTVETHRRQIMDKLELRSVAELTKFALREGLTDLGA